MKLFQLASVLALGAVLMACQTTQSNSSASKLESFKARYVKAQNEPFAELAIPNKIKTDLSLTDYHHKVIREQFPLQRYQHVEQLNVADYDEATQNTIGLISKLRNHQFDELNAELAQLQQQYETNQTLENEETLFAAYASFNLAYEQDLEHLNKWVAHSKPYSLIARATYLHSFAWLIRGHSYVYKTKVGNLNTTRHLNTMARNDAFSVLAENDQNLVMLQIINKTSKLNTWYLSHNWFYGAAEKYPNSRHLIKTYASSLYTRWGGKQVQRDLFLNYLSINASWALPEVIENFNKYEINTDTKEPLFTPGYYDAFLPSEGTVNTAQNAEDFQPRYSEILKDAEYYKNIRALHKQKQFEPCLSQAQLSIYLGRASEKVVFAKATCYSGLKQYQQALTMLDILQKIYPNAFMRNQAKFRKFLNRRVNASKVI
ncbi:DUF4034 domain-containing protein [Catenovulum maritimum]|uniref:DUF4034 domain-containing protein n=1 Tax=Catenovulum maritimum TaxID=1513271 RepID=A0A0J8GPW3_9ALTE|nr:DUF4034 domain-containing protein [Catenovulum maritimum]KMT64807.1 hypothetical protein XM47_12200 [Catenovulum maritimum]